MKHDRGRRLILIFFLSVSFGLWGCAGLEKSREGAFVHVLPFKPEIHDIVNLHTGKKISFEELLSELEKMRVIYVGEVHARASDHEIQRRIVEGLWERGKNIGVGVEMLPRSTQGDLDRWVEGNLDETSFLNAVLWEDNWGFPFALYRPVFALAREKSIPMRALNAPPAVVRKVSRQGLASLNAEERRSIAGHFYLDDEVYRSYVEKEFKAHVPGSIRDLQAFYEAQLVWDETMAETIAMWLVQEPFRQVVVLAGKGHVNQRFGIPERVRRRVEHRYAVVIPVAINEEPDQVTAEVADFLVVTAAQKPFEGHGRRLGVRLERNPKGDGLRVVEVVSGSRADLAGFQAGDMIMAVDGESVRDLESLHRLFQRPVPEMVFTLDRDGRTITIPVRFEP
ncbi:MAG: ChaN family lipoprotein [Desulfosoma sp.]